MKIYLLSLRASHRIEWPIAFTVKRHFERIGREPRGSKRCRGSRDERARHFVSALLAFVVLLLNTAAGADPARGTPQSIEPFSLNYSLGYSRRFIGFAVAECAAGYRGVVVGGHLSDPGNAGRVVMQWLAHVDAPGHIHWAVQAGDGTTPSACDLTCRQNVVFCTVHTGPNSGLIGKFNAESLAPVKVVQVRVTPLLNQAVLDWHREPSLPVAVSMVQDNGDTVALAVISQDPEIALNKTYSIAAFAIRERDQNRPVRCRVFRAQDGSGSFALGQTEA